MRGPACPHHDPARPPGRGHWVCLDCQVRRRLDRVLDDGTGQPNPALAPLAEAIRTSRSTAAAASWLANLSNRQLLWALARGELPLTHEALHAWPRPLVANHIRGLLMHAGLLPAGDKRLLDFEAWLQRWLARTAGHPHIRLLRQYALWDQLSRLRAAAARGGLRITATKYAANEIKYARAFLDWLVESGKAPSQLTQADLDRWETTRPSQYRKHARNFLIWAIGTGHVPPLQVAPMRYRVGEALTQTDRLELLRRYLHNRDVALTLRVVICLLLLYGQPITRTLELRVDDVEQDAEGRTRIAFGHPASPVPAPFDDLLLAMVATAKRHGPTDRGLLFPGRNVDQPLSYDYLVTRLRAAGFPLRAARISGLRQLVLQAPAPVVATALGVHQTTTHRQVINAGGTWHRYPGLARDRPHRGPVLRESGSHTT